MPDPASAIRWLFASRQGPAEGLIPRWLFLCALGLIYLSAFFSLYFLYAEPTVQTSQMYPRVTRATQSYQIFFIIVTGMAAELFVMYLKV